ncbi:MAG: hypothetical protein GX638_14900, partial [Crenarchaeota archaeon]|nr:hypothetical protein [Thermoproteota archaeon]
MKRVTIPLMIGVCLVFVFVFCASGCFFINYVNANPAFVDKYPITVTITSPEENAYFLIGSFSVNFTLDNVAVDKIAYRFSTPITIKVKIDESIVSEKEVIYHSSGRAQNFS